MVNKKVHINCINRNLLLSSLNFFKRHKIIQRNNYNNVLFGLTYMTIRVQKEKKGMKLCRSNVFISH